MNQTTIDWTSLTWNPVSGCTPASTGCKNCYARALAGRLSRMGNPAWAGREFSAVKCHPERLGQPIALAKGSMVFVNSMGDLLHEEIPDAFIQQVFDVMRATPRHTYQVLTKRAERWPAVEAMVGGIPRNVWPGVSVEDAEHLWRLEPLGLLRTPEVRMVSFEPLLGSLGSSRSLAADLHRCRIGWVITGGESGFSARPAELTWFRGVRDACAAAGVPFFHKQHGGRGVTHAAKLGGDLAVIDGVLHRATPSRS